MKYFSFTAATLEEALHQGAECEESVSTCRDGEGEAERERWMRI